MRSEKAGKAEIISHIFLSWKCAQIHALLLQPLKFCICTIAWSKTSWFAYQSILRSPHPNCIFFLLFWLKSSNWNHWTHSSPSFTEFIYASLPRTNRGQPIVLGGDPKGKNFLYTNGNSVIIRNIDVSSSKCQRCDMKIFNFSSIFRIQLLLMFTPSIPALLTLPNIHRPAFT